MAKECPTNVPDCKQAELAAESAVRKVFAILGVDIDKPESVEEFREDLRWGKRMRRASDRGWLAIVSLICAGIVYAAWSGIKGSVGH